MADLAELKCMIKVVGAKLQGKATSAKLNRLIEKIHKKETAIKKLVDQVNNLETRPALIENTYVLLELRCDDLESYT